jgi:hypothetical protein
MADTPVAEVGWLVAHAPVVSPDQGSPVFSNVTTEYKRHRAEGSFPARLQIVSTITTINDKKIEVSTIDAALDTGRPETCVFIKGDSHVVAGYGTGEWGKAVEEHEDIVKTYASVSSYFDLAPKSWEED